MLAGAGVIAGGAVIAVGTRLAWAKVTIRGAPVAIPGFPRVALSGGRITLDASGVAAGWVFGVGLLIALVPLAWLVLGWQGRLVLGVIAFAAAVIVFYQAAANRADFAHRAQDVALRQALLRSADLHVQTGPGIPVTAGGATLAALCSVWGSAVGRKVPRLGLPEEPPDRPDLNGQR